MCIRDSNYDIKFIVISDVSNFIYCSIKLPMLIQSEMVIKCTMYNTLYMCVHWWQRRLYRPNRSWCLVVLAALYQVSHHPHQPYSFIIIAIINVTKDCPNPVYFIYHLQ